MYLKTLTLRGFKSFASSTTLRFEPGITAVVGPNGSGKSNVVDALTWVMGEQGAKSLRGAKMVDVIFAGTSLRPALGRAEVSLTIDNSDGLLPIEYTEVTITRTMFRGGGSEYSINGSPVRLLDIQELLSDTGMGKQMHVVVGQGRLDEILSATPLERRGFIEESAGVLKHRRRKERALSKLEAMSGKAARVHDMSQELKRQLGPLSRQAKAAQKAAGIQAQIKDARARLLAAEVSGWQDKLSLQTSNVEELRAERAILKEEHSVVSQKISESEAAAKQSRDKFDEITRACGDLSAVLERSNSLLALGRERKLNFDSQPAYEGPDPEYLEQKSKSAAAEYESLSQELDDSKIKLADVLVECQKADSVEIATANEFAAISQRRAQWREQRARSEGDVAQAVSRLESAKLNAARSDEELAAAQQRLETAEAELTEFKPATLTGQHSALQKHDEAVAFRDKARNELDQLLEQERDMRDTIAHWQARAEALSQAIAPDDSTSELLGSEHFLGQLSELCTVTPGWEVAIAAALNPFVEAGFTVSFEQARLAMEKVSGSARSIYMPFESKTVSGQKKSQSAEIKWARELVQSTHAEVNLTLDYALDLIAVVDEDIQAEQLLYQDLEIRAVVSKTGTVFTRWSIWKPGEGGANSLALQAQYEKAQSEAKSAQIRLEQHLKLLAIARNQLDQAIKDANQAIKQLRQADSEAAEAAAHKSQLETAKRMAEAELVRIKQTHNKLTAEVSLRTEQLEEVKARLEESETSEQEPDPSEAKSKMEDAAQAAKELHSVETDLRLSLAKLEERVRSADARAQSLRRAAQAERQERAKQEGLEQRRKIALNRVSNIISQTEALIAKIENALSQAQAERAIVAAQQQDTASEVRDQREQLELISQRLNELTEGIHHDELAHSEIKLQLENVVRTSRLELNLEPSELVAQYGPHQPVPEWLFDSAIDPDSDFSSSETRTFVRAEVEAAGEAARRRLDRLGKVNPLALEEFQAVTERYEYIESQLADLEQSKLDLLKIVKEVDRYVLEVFESAFRDTANAFREVFATLFPGGEGRLVLTDPDDLLSTGIEVHARPAGKKVSRLSLLSGGERSLVAVAMLVAIFIARPSPFYVMDEVEAALDDTNLGRLLRIFKKLRENSQLIVITHQKRTMEVADALYGITMRDGITRVVSQRLEKES